VLIADFNILVYAFREDAPDHPAYKDWLDATVAGHEAIGISELVLSGFLRIVTHPRIFRPPTPMSRALEFAEAFRTIPSGVRVAPGDRHWSIFTGLCRAAGAKGNLLPDAYLAALAIESGSDWLTTDREYARFPGLRWRHPLEKRS
jgi:toxin-antitoxin system PIN domain toxin